MRDRIIVKKIYETFAITDENIYGDDDYDDGGVYEDAGDIDVLVFLKL